MVVGAYLPPAPHSISCWPGDTVRPPGLRRTLRRPENGHIGLVHIENKLYDFFITVHLSQLWYEKLGMIKINNL